MAVDMVFTGKHGENEKDAKGEIGGYADELFF